MAANPATKGLLKTRIADLDTDLLGVGKSLGNVLGAYAASRRASNDEVLKRVGLEAFNRIKARTPVDTGAARKAWSIEFTENGSRAVVLIANRVSYIVFLEVGSSTQAPSGMVRITLAEIARELAENLAGAK